ncbi:MAG: hypothetical protein FWD54_02310 [Endomicrobia bacterium]|nr:hypothetical protein [Endomicrobiia bacterium]
MKKIIILILSMCVFANVSFAYGSLNYEDFGEYKSKYRILYGLLLIVGGGALAYDGFRTVKVDISKPSYSITASGRWFEGPFSGQVTLESIGTFTNTGNVVLRDIAFQVRYRSTGYQAGAYFPDQGIPYDPNNPVGVWVNFPPDPDTGIVPQTLYTSEIGQTCDWSRGPEPFSLTDTAGQWPDAFDQNTWYSEELDPEYPLVEVINVEYNWDKKYKEEMNNVYEGIAGAVLLGAGVYILVDYLVSLKRFNYYMKKHGMDIYVENYYDEFRLKLSKKI